MLFFAPLCVHLVVDVLSSNVSVVDTAQYIYVCDIIENMISMIIVYSIAGHTTYVPRCVGGIALIVSGSYPLPHPYCCTHHYWLMVSLLVRGKLV